MTYSPVYKLYSLYGMNSRAARKLEKSRDPTPGAFYAGAMFGYEDCADGLAMLLKEVLAAEIER